MPVKFKKIHGNLFPGDVAGFDAETEAALVASGKAEPVEGEEADVDKKTTPPADKVPDPKDAEKKAPATPPADKAAKPPTAKG